MPDPAPFDAPGILQYLLTLVQGLPTMQQANLGVTESIDATLNAWLTLGDCTPKPVATQTAQREPEVMVTFVARVAGDETTAELLIAHAVDELTAAVFADRRLGGTSQNAVMDMSLNRDPAYMNLKPAEVRRYIVVVRGLQTMNTP